jgi:hypothetical protein
VQTPGKFKAGVHVLQAGNIMSAISTLILIFWIGKLPTAKLSSGDDGSDSSQEHDHVRPPHPMYM